jgi:glycosyltransferase EpsF
MKRILHVVGGMNRAGAETMLMNLYRQIDRDNYQFDFLYFNPQKCDYDDEIIKNGGQIFRVLSSNIFLRYYKIFKLLKSENNIQSVHSHMNINNSVYLFIAYLSGKKNRISHSHSTEGIYYQSLFRKIYKTLSFGLIKRFATQYVACGKAAGEYLYPKVDLSKIQLLPNAINLKQFSESRIKNRNYLRKLYKINNDTIVLSQIGRLSKVKNHNFSINFCKYLKQKKVNFHFVIIGAGELRPELELIVNNEQLNKEISFMGVRSDVPELLSGSDCILMPSLHEAFPVVLVESQAMGVPSLISDTVSPEVDLGLNLVEFANLNDEFLIWENKLIQMISQDEVDSQIITKQMTDRGFNIVESAKKIEKLYEQ